ncbi:MAG: hypothetical protein LQ351_004902 [Letrouitia transgressa]|nr:MAG: hypothetical protein LQ351_004902 [Letrouitia transgressa]
MAVLSLYLYLIGILSSTVVPVYTSPISDNVSSTVSHTICVKRQQAPWGIPANEHICAPTLAVLTHSASYRTPHTYGPGFHNITWQAPHEPCHIFIKSNSFAARASISFESIVTTIHYIFEDCRYFGGYGGVKVISFENPSFVAGVYAVNGFHADGPGLDEATAGQYLDEQAQQVQGQVVGQVEGAY